LSFWQVGFRLDSNGHVVLDPAHVFSKFPGWSAFSAEKAQKCLDSISPLVEIAKANGVLTEADFTKAGLDQTKEEKEAEIKTPRDNFPLHRHRAVLLTSEGSRKRVAERKAAAEAKKQEAEKKKQSEQERVARQKRLAEGWEALKHPDTDVPQRPKKKYKDDCQCALCFTWYGAMQDDNFLPEEEFKWRGCESCGQWFCPYCLHNYDGVLKMHERCCWANKFGEKKRPGKQTEGKGKGKKPRKQAQM
jgi:hypothetical protein